MIKSLIISIALLFSLPIDTNKQLSVIDKEMYVKFDPGLVITNDPVLITFKGTKYLLQTKESFDINGEINQAAIIGDVGYTTYSRRLIYEFKNFLNENHLDNFIRLTIVSNNSINLNSKIIPVEKIDPSRKEIFYRLKDRDVVYKISYR